MTDVEKLLREQLKEELPGGTFDMFVQFLKDKFQQGLQDTLDISNIGDSLALQTTYSKNIFGSGIGGSNPIFAKGTWNGLAIGGYFSSYNNQYSRGLVIIDSNGKAINKYECLSNEISNFYSPFINTVENLTTLEGSDVIIVGGIFSGLTRLDTNQTQQEVRSIAVFNLDGTVNAELNNIISGFVSSNPSLSNYPIITKIQSYVDDNGNIKLLISGDFISYKGDEVKGICSLNLDGTLNTDFINPFEGLSASFIRVDDFIIKDQNLILKCYILGIPQTSMVYHVELYSGNIINTIDYNGGMYIESSKYDNSYILFSRTINSYPQQPYTNTMTISRYDIAEQQETEIYSKVFNGNSAVQRFDDNYEGDILFSISENGVTQVLLVERKYNEEQDTNTWEDKELQNNLLPNGTTLTNIIFSNDYFDSFILLGNFGSFNQSESDKICLVNIDKEDPNLPYKLSMNNIIQVSQQFNFDKLTGRTSITRPNFSQLPFYANVNEAVQDGLQSGDLFRDSSAGDLKIV